MKKYHDVSFFGNLLLRNDSRLNINDFKIVDGKEVEPLIDGEQVKNFSFSFRGNYLCAKISSGSALPRSPSVYNLKDRIAEPNPRSEIQVEPKDSYALIDFDRSFLWISDRRHRYKLLEYFKDEFSVGGFIVKDVYNEETLRDTLKRLDEIKIVATPNLLSETNVLTKALSDELNLFGAYEAELSLKYKNVFVGPSIFEKVKSLFRGKNAMKSVVIAGRDEKGLGTLFDSSKFSRKIELKVRYGENGVLDEADVFSELIKGIGSDEY